MRRITHWLAAATILLPLASPAAAQDAPGLAAITPWNLHYDDDSCVLRRAFGEEERQVYLELRRFYPGESLQAVVASNWMKPRNPSSFRYRFGQEGEWRDVPSGITLSLPEGYNGVLFMPKLIETPEFKEVEDPVERALRSHAVDWRGMERKAAAGAATLTLRGAFNRAIDLQTGSLEQPMEALNQCTDELMTRWGIDVEAHKTLTRPAVPINLPEVPRMIDYPPEMIRQSMPGVVNIRLSIDETGRITACHIQLPLSDPSFEDTSCVDIQHALEFEPALDKDGKPIASYWVTRVVFQLSS